MKVDIHLRSKRNRSTLVKLCRRLLPDYKIIRIRKKEVILKTRWYSFEKTRISVVDLVLLHIPQLINDLYEENGYDAVYDYEDSLGAAVEYFGVHVIGVDLIQSLQYQLDNMDMSGMLNDYYNAEPALLEIREVPHVEETYATKKIFNDSILHYYNLITDVIKEIHPNLKVVYMNTKSACNSPPIRSPSEYPIVTLLSA